MSTPERTDLGDTLSVRSDHSLETSLAAGVLFVDGEGRTTLLRYQPRNTSGAVFVTTLQLLSYTALTEESDRQAVLARVLSWQRDASAGKLWEAVGTAGTLAPSRDDVVTTILALAAVGTAKPRALQRVAREYLGVDLPEDRLRRSLEDLESEGVLRRA